MFPWLLTFLIEHTKLSFGIGALTGALSIPLVTHFIAQQDVKAEYLFREYDICEPTTSSTCTPKTINTFDDFDVVETSYKELIKGTKNYNKGNYVIYFGSEKCPYCNGLLFNEYGPDAPKTNKGQAYKKSKWHDLTDFTTYRDEMREYNIKYLMFSDAVPNLDNMVNSDLSVLPWKSWPTTDLVAGKVKGSYVRNDASAVNFRNIREIMKITFTDAKMKFVPAIIVYKGGVPKIFGEDKFPDLEKVWKSRNESKPKPADDKAGPKPWSASEPNDLIEYLYYWYKESVIPSTEVTNRYGTSS